MSDILEIKNIIDAQGKAWEEFKKTNDELIKAKADGKSVADIEAKLAKVSADLDKQAELKAEFDEVLKKLNRPGAANEKAVGIEVECKSFNLHLRSAAQMGGKSVPTEMTVDHYQAYKSAFFKSMVSGIDSLEPEERKAMSAGNDADGGYLLPVSTVGRVVAKLFELSPMRQICTVQPISTDALEGVADNDEADAGWVNELGTRSDTDTPQLGKYRIEAHEMYAQPKVSQKLLDDAAVDVEAWIADKVANKFARVEAAGYVTGDGVGKPRGFTTYSTAATTDATRAWGVFEHIMSGASADFAASTPADKLFDLVGALKPAYKANASFATRRDVVTKVRKFKEATTNGYIWQPGLQAGQPDRLLGYPIVDLPDMPALGADSLSLAFGDFREAYTIVDRIGIRTLRDPFTAKPYVRFYSTKRTGGAVVNFEALKFLKFNT
jgi:HK97 family phage major capsid protein